MNKYWAVIKNNFLTTLEYRASIFAWRICELLSLGSALFVWLAIYRDNQMMGSYSFGGFVTYYLWVPFIRSFTDIYVTDHLTRFIKDGDISKILLKPVNVLGHEFAIQVGAKISGQVLRVPFHVAIIIVVSLILHLVIPIGGLPLALCFCLLAYVLNFFIDTSLALLTFWMDDSWALSHLKNVMVAILGGVAFPLDILPKNIAGIFNILPFKFSTYFPLSIAQGRADLSGLGRELILLISWTLFFFTVTQVLWKAGMKKYNALGG